MVNKWKEILTLVVAVVYLSSAAPFDGNKITAGAGSVDFPMTVTVMGYENSMGNDVNHPSKVLEIKLRVEKMSKEIGLDVDGMTIESMIMTSDDGEIIPVTINDTNQLTTDNTQLEQGQEYMLTIQYLEG
jgi:hypothetical protein